MIVYLFRFAFFKIPRKNFVLVGGEPPPEKFSDIWKG